ncbi:hypothetical protein [Actinoplanes sp. NPDC026619]|uniref:hypothetical protein n=1 Tax=Actinoplanes sp. NPDC026619 TaxID=3155798 RepID=UPI0033C4930C
MKWILLIFGLLAVAGIVAVGWQTSEVVWASRTWRGIRSRSQPTPPVRCLPCHGTGRRGGEPERTMNFVGGGFEDRHSPATICPDCAGTGIVRG